MTEIKKITFKDLRRAHSYIDRALCLGYVCSMVVEPGRWIVRVIRVDGVY